MIAHLRAIFLPNSTTPANAAGALFRARAAFLPSLRDSVPSLTSNAALKRRSSTVVHTAISGMCDSPTRANNQHPLQGFSTESGRFPQGRYVTDNLY